MSVPVVITIPSPRCAASRARCPSPSAWASVICGPGSASTFSARSCGHRLELRQRRNQLAGVERRHGPLAAHRDRAACREQPHRADERSECLLHGSRTLTAESIGRQALVWRLRSGANLLAMATATELLADPQLLETEWDLGPLVDGDEEHGVQRQLEEACERAGAFAETYVSRVEELSSTELAEAMHELAVINELVGRAGSYASLRFATDTADAKRGAQLQLSRSGRPRSRPSCCSSSSSGPRCPTSAPTRYSPTTRLSFCAHYLRSARRYRPHLLTEPEEKILAEKSIASRAAWNRLFGEQVAALRVALDGEQISLEVALSRLQSADRDAAPHSRRGGLGHARPRDPHARLHLQHADPRQGRRRPAALVPALAREPQPRKRGVGRVGARADRRDPCAVTTSPSAGTGSRPSCSALTGSPTTTAPRRCSPRI